MKATISVELLMRIYHLLTKNGYSSEAKELREQVHKDECK